MTKVWIVTVYDIAVNQFLTDHNKVFLREDPAQDYFEELLAHKLKYGESWHVACMEGELDETF